jgi:hypothetical protein
MGAPGTLALRRARAYAAAMRRACRIVLLLLPCLSACSAWWFSGEERIDRSRPVALVETTGGVELGATTELGVLTLGRTAAAGPCRVHYFLGPTPLIETGELEPTGSVFTRAVIDLKTQLVRVMDRTPTVDDELAVMWTADGTNEHTIAVALARGDGLAGDLLRDPGQPVPTGATVLCRAPEGTWLFAGLVAGTATVAGGPTAGRYVVFAGVDRVRELLAVPQPYPTTELRTKYRPDDITVTRPAK